MTIHGKHVSFNQVAYTQKFGPVFTKKRLAVSAAKRMSRLEWCQKAYTAIVVLDDNVTVWTSH